jgi:hypothetical protein
MKHKWKYCGHCKMWMVICGKCGNNTCNSGSGDIKTGEPCEDGCEEAYTLMKEGMPKIIIAGGRTFNNWDYLVDCVNSTEPPDPFQVVSGGAKGADALGERYAVDNNYPIKKFPADWNKYGKGAGPIRNEQMADYADGLIAFWDQKSRGTAHMISTAKAKGLEVKIFTYERTM